VPWYTGWGLNEVLTLGGVTGSDAEGGADDEVVFAVVPAVASEHLLPEPMRLAAMSGTRTMTLRLDGLVVGDEQVVHRSPVRVWRERDRRGAVATNPAVLGVAAAALDRLEQGARRVGSREGLAAVAALRSRLDDVSARIDALIDRSAEVADEADAVAAEQVHLRTLAHRVALDVTAALVGAGGGRAMSLTDPAQRWAREALFLVVQAQTAPARADFLSSFG
jgi:alkylation response protein AidB-like acyl-CoA dehydrogenase